MKFTARTILGFLLIPLLLIALILSTIRFQVLSPLFWQNTLRNNNVYTNLASVLKTAAEEKTVKEGGSLKEVKVLTNLITPANLQEFIEKNVKNLLDFANGKTKEAMVFVPVKILPNGLLPPNLGKITENTPLATLLTEFNVQGIKQTQIENFAKTGQSVDYLLALDIALIALILIGIFVLTDKSKRFIAPAVVFILWGIIILVLSQLWFISRTNILADWAKSVNLTQIILSPFAPYVLDEILKTWTLVGIFAIVTGIVLIFLKKK
ncbi:MAG TPA: hypothetical protein VKC54_00415 [Patescibacteria group bacterium]|nr:hypothetical protein [Patescibacteria group bacterium]